MTLASQSQHTHPSDPPRHNPHRASFRKWTEEEWQQVAELRRAGHDHAYIASIVRRTERQVKDKIYWMEMSGEKREERLHRIRSWRHQKDKHGSSPSEAIKRAPTSALADRDARLLAHRSLTAIAFGDPPPGWSALDRREE